MRRWLLLSVSVCFGDDAQQEGGGLVGTEGGRNNQVLGRFQHQELHHLAGVHVGFGLGDGRVRLEERGRELSAVCLVLGLGRDVQLGLDLQVVAQVCRLKVENQTFSYLISHLEGNRQSKGHISIQTQFNQFASVEFFIVTARSCVLRGTCFLFFVFSHLLFQAKK